MSYGLELVWYLCVVYIPTFFAQKAESLLKNEIQVRNLQPSLSFIHFEEMKDEKMFLLGAPS